MKLTRTIYPSLLAAYLSYFPVAHSASAPIRISGNLTSTYTQRDFNGGESQSTAQLNIATINASSYIWQPWFALINGGLSFSTNKLEFEGGAPTRNKSLNGNLQLNVFPTSRFPFLFYTARNQNDTKDQLLTRVTTTHITGIKQQYKSRNGLQSYSGSYEHNKRIDFENSSTTNDKVNFTGRFDMEDHSISSILDYDQMKSAGETDSTNYNANLRHSYSGYEDISLESLASSAQTRSDFLTNYIDTQNTQVGSFLNWRPGDNPDLIVTGNFLASRLKRSTEQKNTIPTLDRPTSIDNSQMNINQGLSYRYNNNISLSQSFNINHSDPAGDRQTIYSESAGISYTADTFDTNLGSYSWLASSNLSHNHGSNIASQSSISSNLAHSIIKDFIVNEEITVNSSFNQSLGFTNNFKGDSSNFLSHSLSASWAHSIQKNQIRIRGTISDSRSNNSDSTQNINLQASDNYQYGRNTTFNTSVTYQKSWIRSESSSGTNQNSNGQVSYSRQRFLDIRSLSLKSMLKFSHQKSSDQQDLIEESDSSIDNSWENKLIYRVGLLEVRANLDFIKNDNDYDRIFLIQFTRSFGVQ